MDRWSQLSLLISLGQQRPSAIQALIETAPILLAPNGDGGPDQTSTKSLREQQTIVWEGMWRKTGDGCRPVRGLVRAHANFFRHPKRPDSAIPYFRSELVRISRPDNPEKWGIHDGLPCISRVPEPMFCVQVPEWFLQELFHRGILPFTR